MAKEKTIEEKINNIELELVIAEEHLSEEKTNKILEGKVKGLRTALHILTGKSYDPADYVSKEIEEE